MSVCGDFGGVTAKGEPCRRPMTDGLCPAHREKAKPGGRPTDYSASACDTVIHLGAEGASRAEWAAELDIAIQTLANWETAHPEFLAATTRARNLAQAWWEKQGRKGIWSRDFNAAAYRLQVMNRFPDDWRDKQSHEHSGPAGGPIEMADVSDDELLRRAGQLKNRIGALAESGAPSTNGKH